MRKIKFRVWDRELEKYNFLNLHDLGEPDEYWYDGETTVWDVLYDSTHEQKRFIVEQYTGLKDKNGVEIYEEDIVELGGVVYKVRYLDAGFKLINRGTITNISRYCKVIGNIHENPEIMGGKRK